jgi:hypothetical protein
VNNTRGRSQLVFGFILILLGAGLLIIRNVPALQAIFGKYVEFPANMFLIGAGFLIFAIVMRRPNLSMPAAIIAGLGGIFYYQETTDIEGSWSYMWTLIPGFIGVGIIVSGLLGDSTAYHIRRGRRWIMLSVVLFLIFSSFFGHWKFLGDYGPAILLIFLGAWVLGRVMYHSFLTRD